MISWISNKQSLVAQSSIEVEYIAASMGAREAVWLWNLLLGLFVLLCRISDRKIDRDIILTYLSFMQKFRSPDLSSMNQVLMMYLEICRWYNLGDSKYVW